MQNFSLQLSATAVTRIVTSLLLIAVVSACGADPEDRRRQLASNAETKQFGLDGSGPQRPDLDDLLNRRKDRLASGTAQNQSGQNADASPDLAAANLDSPFGIIEFMSATRFLDTQNLGDHVLGTQLPDALSKLLTTGSNANDSASYWNCKTQSSGGAGLDVTVTLHGDRSAYVGWENASWTTVDDSSVNILVEGRGTIRWQQIEFGMGQNQEIKLLARDSRGEKSDCSFFAVASS